MKTFRLKKSEDRYLRDIKSGNIRELWEIKALVEFKHFKIVVNEYPHDRITKVHHLLIPKRKVNDWKKLRWYERLEFKKIDSYLSRHYDCIKLNYPSLISVPNIVHWHLYKLKR